VRRFDDETELLDTIYRGVTDGGALDDALDRLRTRYDCDGGAFVLFDMHVPASDLMLTSGAWGADIVERYREVAPFDPAPRAFALLPRGRASSTDRLFDPAFKETSAFWNDFYHPNGFTETLGAALFAEKSRFAVLGLHRGACRTPFGDDDIADLERILPHLVRAFQLRRRFVGLEARAQGLENMLDRLESGVVMLDAAGALSVANQAARLVFARGDGIGLDKAGCLMIGPAGARGRLAGLMAGIARGEAGGVVGVPRVGGAAYALLVAPMPGAGDDWFAAPLSAGHAIVLIHDPDRRPRDAAAILQQALGLTPGAARLVAALAADDDLKSFADAAGVTIHTARFHLRAALARTQTATQAELVRLAVRLLRDFALRGD
jgi:DNA-binding CsgD family transcriptional regulator